jgi:hypothetical protein
MVYILIIIIFFFASNNSHPPSALMGERASVSTWHSRLGHPALKVVRQVLSSFQLPITLSMLSKIQTYFQVKIRIALTVI